MPDLSPWHGWLVFIHVLGVFVFLIFHGASVAVMFRIRRERDPAVLRPLLDLSAWSMAGMGLGAAIWFFTGILAGFSGNYWATGRLWLWVSLLLTVVIVGLMTPLGAFYINRVRRAVGIDPKTRAVDPGFVPDPVAIEAAARSGSPLLLAAIGFGGLGVLLYLMMFKPF